MTITTTRNHAATEIMWSKMHAIRCVTCQRTLQSDPDLLDEVAFCSHCNRRYRLVVYPYCPKCGTTLDIDGSRLLNMDDGKGIVIRETKIPGKLPKFRCPSCNEVVPDEATEPANVVKAREEFLEMVFDITMEHVVRSGNRRMIGFTSDVERRVGMPIREIARKIEENRDVIYSEVDVSTDVFSVMLKFKNPGIERARWISIIDDDGMPLNDDIKNDEPRSKLPPPGKHSEDSTVEGIIDVMKKVSITFREGCEAELHAKKIKIRDKKDLVGAILDLFIKRVSREMKK